MPSGKMPGPDGYTKEFFVAAWSIVDQNLLRQCNHFSKWFHAQQLPQENRCPNDERLSANYVLQYNLQGHIKHSRK